MRVEHLPITREQEILFTDFLTGCALFLPLRVVQEVGFLDETFFLYYEDADYSVRVMKKKIPLAVVTDAIVTHSEESRFNDGKVYHLVFSGLIFFLKHSGLIFSFYQAIYVILRRLKNALDCFLGKPYAKRVAQAYQDFYASKKSGHFTHFC